MDPDRSAPPVPGRRPTRKRAAIANLLGQLDDFRSARDLHDELRARGENVGLTTVYRALQSLTDAGEIDMVRIDSGQAVYRRCSSRRHHHLVCRACGHAVEVDGPVIDQWAREIGAQNGFSDVSHTLEVFGTCGACGG